MPNIKDSQHCVYEGDDDYTFSHTAGLCGRPQHRRCGCAFCYPDAEHEANEKTVYILINGDNEIRDVYADKELAERELHWMNNKTDEAKRLASYGRHDWYRLIEKELVE